MRRENLWLVLVYLLSEGVNARVVGRIAKGIPGRPKLAGQLAQEDVAVGGQIDGTRVQGAPVCSSAHHRRDRWVLLNYGWISSWIKRVYGRLHGQWLLLKSEGGRQRLRLNRWSSAPAAVDHVRWEEGARGGARNHWTSVFRSGARVARWAADPNLRPSGGWRIESLAVDHHLLWLLLCAIVGNAVIRVEAAVGELANFRRETAIGTSILPIRVKGDANVGAIVCGKADLP